MAVVDIENRSIVAKIVYFGPAQSGKTTNLRVLYDVLAEDQRGDMPEFESPDQATIFFDYFPVELGNESGFDITLRLFTVSGQEGRSDARRAILTGADGVVFVADTSAGREDENARSMNELVEALSELHPSAPDSIPIVIQYNKLDLSEKSGAPALMRELGRSAGTIAFASALERRGVVETLELITREVVRTL